MTAGWRGAPWSRRDHFTLPVAALQAVETPVLRAEVDTARRNVRIGGDRPVGGEFPDQLALTVEGLKTASLGPKGCLPSAFADERIGSIARARRDSEPLQNAPGMDDDGRQKAVARREFNDPVPRPGLPDDMAFDVERAGLDEREAQGERVDQRLLDRSRAGRQHQAGGDERGAAAESGHGSGGIIYQGNIFFRQMQAKGYHRQRARR